MGQFSEPVLSKNQNNYILINEEKLMVIFFYKITLHDQSVS